MTKVVHTGLSKTDKALLTAVGAFCLFTILGMIGFCLQSRRLQFMTNPIDEAIRATDAQSETMHAYAEASKQQTDEILRAAEEARDFVRRQTEHNARRGGQNQNEEGKDDDG